MVLSRGLAGLSWTGGGGGGGAYCVYRCNDVVLVVVWIVCTRSSGGDDDSGSDGMVVVVVVLALGRLGWWCEYYDQARENINNRGARKITVEVCR